MKKVLFYILFVFFGVSASGQANVDSLLHILPTLSGIDSAEACNQLSLYFSGSDSLQSLKFANVALDWSQRNQNDTVKATALFNLGECYYSFDVNEKALEYYLKALDEYKKLNDSLNIGESLNSIGLVYYFSGDYNSAAAKFFNSLDYLKSSETRGNAAHVYSNLGMLNNRIGDNHSAVYNYRFAANLNKQIQDTASLAVNYNGLGVTYYNLTEYDSAKVYYNKALRLFQKLKNRKREAIALNNIANIYVNVGDSLSRAMNYYEDALKVFDELKDVRSKAFVLEGLGSIYREVGEYNKAISSFETSIALAKRHHLGYYIQQLNYNDLSITYERMGKTQLAFDAFKSYSFYKDSLLQEQRLDQVAELEKKYETQQKEAEISRLNASRQIDQLQIKRDHELRTFGIIAILLLVSIIFVISIAYINKKQINELLNDKNAKIEEQRLELEKLNASKNKFFSIIAHDLKNPFHTVMGYSYLLSKEYDHLPDMERRKYSSDLYKSASLIFRLLENLLDWSRSQTGRLKYTPQEIDFHDIYENIHSLLKPIADQKHIKLLTEIDDEDAHVFADPMMLETILRNLMNNAIKFTPDNGWVKTIVKGDGANVQVCVQDNGIGIQNDELVNLFRIDSKVKRKGTNQEDGSGLGLIICEEFVKKNGGNIWVNSQQGKGSQFYFTIPRS